LILCLKIIGLSLVSFAIGFFSRYIIINAALVFGENSRNKIFKYLVDLSMRYFSKNSVGEVMTLTTNDVKVVQHTIRMLIMAGSRVIFLIIMSFIAMTSVANFKLTIAAFAPFPLLTIFIIYYGKIIRKRFRIVQDSYANLARKTEDNIMSMKVVKAFCREDDEEIDFEKYNEQNFQANLSMIRSTAIYHPIIVLVASVSFMILIGMGGSMVIKGVITLGAYVASMQYVSNIIHPFVMVARLLENLQRARASMSRIDDFFVNSPDIHDNTNEAEFKKNVDIKDKLEGSIDFNHLSFSYQDDDKDINKVLDDITLRVNKGECLGIIGKIGSGKSTIVNLLLRLYDTEGDGMINIDGYDIKKIPLSLLSHSIGYVPQDNFLFSDTIENNINLGIDNDIDVTKYTEISQIHDSIMDLPEKYSTILGERGVNLSGGQKQRMSIARALVREPSILILDDCLSAVDTYTEKAILKRLRPFIKDRTTIIIAHRISALLNADKILVLDNGKMIQYGSHDELLKVEGIYKSIYDKQLLEDKIRSVKKEGE
jgi:ATP-binding cassette subfamily B protein